MSNENAREIQEPNGNRDPIPGEIDAHPVGTGIEAADAASGGAIGGPVGGVVSATIEAVSGGLAGKKVAE